jgi:DNA-binding MarR family transcriptional regulator
VPSRTETALADQESYNAVIATLKTIRYASTELFGDEGITEPQLQALELLSEKGPLLMREISEAMFVTPANITGIIDRLEEKKLVKRTSRKEDRRASVIEITPEGKTLFEKVWKKKGDMIQKSFGVFTRDEKITLNRLLEKFQKSLTKSIDELHAKNSA